MLLKRDEDLLEVAAKETMRRIRKDYRERATARVRPLVLYIKENLFDFRLDVATVMRDCEVRDHSVAVLFNRDLGESPAVYIRHRRLEVGARLLVDTELKIWKIASLLGFGDPSTFGERFKDWTGSAPTVYRKTVREAAATADSRERRLQEVAKKILEGQADELDLDELDFLQLWTDAQRHAKSPSLPGALTVDGAALERGLAMTHWEKLKHLSPRDQKILVRQPYAPTTTALFDLLRMKSREEGRKDRQEGVRIAELALASLDGIAPHLTPEELANRTAQGWAWLGNARRLALDFPEAEQAFAEAQDLLPEDPELQVLAEICELEGELFLFQSKFEEALKLKNRAVRLFRKSGRNRSLAESLLTRAITKFCSRGSESAIPDFLEAVKVAELSNDPHLSACANQSLVTAFALAGYTEKALQQLSVARAHCTKTDDRMVSYHLQWAESLIARQQGQHELCEKHLLEVRSDFAAIGEPLFAATVDLDLAELYLGQGLETKAVSQALCAFPVFEHFNNQPEAVAALALLGDIATEQTVSFEVVRAIRAHLAYLGQHPIALRI